MSSDAGFVSSPKEDCEHKAENLTMGCSQDQLPHPVPVGNSVVCPGMVETLRDESH